MKKAIKSTGNPTAAERHAVFCAYPLQRPNYFHGRLLGVDDFVAEQEYHRKQQRLHNLHCHGAGVVHGLQVTVANDKTGWTVIIQAGVAIDPAGNEVHLCAPTKFPLFDSATEIQVGIRWVERLSGSIPVAGSDPGVLATMPANVEEGCEVILNPEATRRSSLVRCSPGEDSVQVLLLARIVRSGRVWRLDRRFKVCRAR